MKILLGVTCITDLKCFYLFIVLKFMLFKKYISLPSPIACSLLVKYLIIYIFLQRPLTRYLPVRNAEFDLRQHIESAGHQIELCVHIHLTSSSCHGYLHKLGGAWKTWKKRWFVFDRIQRALLYYSDKGETKLKGGVNFKVRQILICCNYVCYIMLI